MAAPSSDIRLVHSSDLHVDDERIAALHGGDGAAGLGAVLATARGLGADIVLLAGDTFDNHMVNRATIDRAGRLLADGGLPVVILPGNHDPATPNSIYVRGGFDRIANLAILAITHDRAVPFPAYDLEIWGNAHRDYQDMAPLRDPPPRSARWHIAMGHGHYEPPETWANPLRPSWLISDQMIAATGADYLALGHWDRAAQVGDAAAATLPVAGLTALHALRQGGLLLGRKVLVDGASGGVGHLACQLALAAGALVWGQVRRPEHRDAVAEWCGGRVVVSRDLAAASVHGPFWLILDSLGGPALGAALSMLPPGGTCVTFGVSDAGSAAVESREFFGTGGARLYGLTLFHELMSVERAGIGLALLAELIAAGKLRPQIAVEAPWGEIGTIARRLIDRDFTGKAVLHIG